MKIFVAVITFAVTIMGLFLFGATETQNGSENTEKYAQIIQELSSQSLNQTPVPKITSKPSKIATRTPTPSPTPIPTPRHFETNTPYSSENQSQGGGGQAPTPISSPSPSSTPTLTLYSPSPTPTQTPQPTTTPTTGHIYYTSSYATAKYYYCDTDDGWKSLSTKYLKSFSSPEELLKAYPNRILHEPCK